MKGRILKVFKSYQIFGHQHIFPIDLNFNAMNNCIMNVYLLKYVWCEDFVVFNELLHALKSGSSSILLFAINVTTEHSCLYHKEPCQSPQSPEYEGRQ